MLYSIVFLSLMIIEAALEVFFCARAGCTFSDMPIHRFVCPVAESV